MANTALGKDSEILIYTATPSASSAVTFTDLTSNYSLYRIDCINISTSVDDASIVLQTSANNGSTYDSGSSDYEYVYFLNDDIQFASSISTANSAIPVVRNIGNASNEIGVGSVFLFRPADARYTYVTAEDYSRASTYYWTKRLIGRRQSAAAVDAIQLKPDTGTFSGQINVYGYKDA